MSDDNRKFAAGFWELYLHELFLRLGYEVTCAAPVGGRRNIDFLLRQGSSSFYVEATMAESQ